MWDGVPDDGWGRPSCNKCATEMPCPVRLAASCEALPLLRAGWPVLLDKVPPGMTEGMPHGMGVAEPGAFPSGLKSDTFTA
jgi:hypothetical protein